MHKEEVRLCEVQGGLAMLENPCLREASVNDISFSATYTHYSLIKKAQEKLKPLYDAEWKKRGFERSP